MDKNSELKIYNSKSKKKEIFKAIHYPYVGMYVCGPTVYGDAHLGHARAAITFDIVFRYLKFLNYKVRYIRNITDVGHLENDADSGEDKIAKKAKLEELEPMEIVQYYSDSYHNDMSLLNVLPPTIEPKASCHIIEQIEMIKRIIDNGYAYEINGSVYFDLEKFQKTYKSYGKLSGRKLEELIAYTRELEGQSEKKSPYDFALWKKASPTHIMKWPSPWGEGYPGWHLECSVMSTKYLGEEFDIHGGGMDLIFPHHECEIAQNEASYNKNPVKYWMHNNLITINGQKMSKSLGNTITLKQIFNGTNDILTKSFSPMTIRFFILQAHYRSPLDFSNDALLAAEKGYKRLSDAYYLIEKIKVKKNGHNPVEKIVKNIFKALNDDFNTAIALSYVFESVKIINQAYNDKIKLSKDAVDSLKVIFNTILKNILGILPEKKNTTNREKQLIELIIDLRNDFRKKKNFEISDNIRDKLSKIGIIIKDTANETTWEYE